MSTQIVFTRADGWCVSFLWNLPPSSIHAHYHILYGLPQSNPDSKFNEEGIISVSTRPIPSNTMALQ